MNKKTAIWVGVGCVAVCLVLVIFTLITGGVVVKWLLQEPENVDIDVLAPFEAIEGESFVIEVRIQNLADQPQLLDSIDISNDYLAGIGITKSEPDFIESYEIPLFPYHSYRFRQNIPPGDTLVVKFFATGLHQGDFEGGLDVCINSESNCSSFLVRTVVRGLDLAYLNDYCESRGCTHSVPSANS